MDLKIFAKTIDDKSKEQINLLVSQEAFKDCKVRIMCDVHAGKGSVIGFTANLGDKVIPNIVGVDIGCGMLTLPLRNRTIDFDKLDKCIHCNVPNGFHVFNNDIQMHYDDMENLYCFDELVEKEHLHHSIGTLGGGNHFIEIDKDDSDNKYLVIHTGSRNLGLQVASIYQDRAIKLHSRNYAKEAGTFIKELKDAGNEKEINAKLKEFKKQYFKEVVKIPADLCYLTGEERLNYLHDMKIAQVFAHDNRLSIAKAICTSMNWQESFDSGNMFETVHNYIDHESNIVRKGAIRAMVGEVVLIPINMKDGSIIGEGLGNEDWNYSAPHGAGRVLSRTKAFDTLSLSEYKKSMEGIYSTSVCKETLDESPMAYKGMEEIINGITPTVRVKKIIKPIYNFKAKG